MSSIEQKKRVNNIESDKSIIYDIYDLASSLSITQIINPHPSQQGITSIHKIWPKLNPTGENKRKNK